MRGKWFLVISLAVILSGSLVGAWFLLRKPKPASPAPRSAEALTLPVGATPTLSGPIRPQHVVTIGSSSSGTIEAFLAEVGQEVFEGDTLARVTSRSQEAAVETAQNAVERAQSRVDKVEENVNSARLEQSRANADMDRSRSAFDDADQQYSKAQNQFRFQAISRNAFDAAQKARAAALADYERKQRVWRTSVEYVNGLEKSAESERKFLDDRTQALSEAKNDLNAADVHAPASGWVVTRNGQAGQSAQEAGDQMFVIATDFAIMEVVLEPEPPILKRLAPGMPALVLIPEMTNAALSGNIKAIDRNQVIVQFDNPLIGLKPGARASVRLKLD
jgi:HlyD family secretion protein